MKLLDVAMDIWDEHSTQFLSAFAIGGAILLPVLASRATLKAKEKIEEAKNSKRVNETAEVVKEELLKGNIVSPEETDNTIEHKELTTVEKIKIGWKYYIPTAICVGVTIGCIIGSEKIHIDKELGLAAMSAMWESRYRVQTERLEELYPNDSLTNLVRDGDAEKEKPLSKRDMLTEFEVYDKTTDQKFKTSMNRIAWTNYVVNERYQKGQRIHWEDVICWLGGKKTGKGRGLGWDPMDEDFLETVDYDFSFFGTYWIDIYADYPVAEVPASIPHIMCNLDLWPINTAN